MEGRVSAKPVGVSPWVPLLGGLESPGPKPRLLGRWTGYTHLLLDEGRGGPADGQQCRVAQRLPYREAAQQSVALRERRHQCGPRPRCCRAGRAGERPPAGRRRSSPGTGPCAAPGRSHTPPRARSPGAAASRTRRPAAWFSRSLGASREGPGGSPATGHPGASRAGGPVRAQPDLFSPGPPKANSGGTNEPFLLVA